MAITPIRPPSVELRCTRNDDGSITVSSYDDGDQIAGSDYFSRNGTCTDVRRIYGRLTNRYFGVPIIVGGACAHCINANNDDTDTGPFITVQGPGGMTESELVASLKNLCDTLARNDVIASQPEVRQLCVQLGTLLQAHHSQITALRAKVAQLEEELRNIDGRTRFS